MTKPEETSMSSYSYIRWAYCATMLTGFSALCAQVVWQRYLTILTGSEARSLTLVVAVFLAGLAGGYYVFGLITERKKWLRSTLLKIYGYIELLTALYLIFFCFYFEFLKILSFQAPSLFIVDVLITLLALLFPAFLMGASIPLLTATLPNNVKDVHTVHAKIYGWNTLGACFGTLISGFYFLPVFGLNGSLLLAGSINLIAAFIFIKNPVKGTVYKQEKLPVIPSTVPDYFYIIFSFLTGAIIISFEVLFIRILHLSMGGARVYNFPFVLALFIGGLALGSLSVNKKTISVDSLIQRTLSSIILMGGLFWLTPYWPLWLNNIRFHLGFAFIDYIVFQIFIFTFIFCFLFPAVFCMGQFLPLIYALLRKNSKNYARVCGALYFCNTLGTVLGAVGIGYLALYILNVDHLFKINIYILILLAFLLVIFEKKVWYAVFLTVFSLVFILVPLGWNQTENYPHYIVRDKQKAEPSTIKKWFFFPKPEVNDTELVYFTDGPNTTVKVQRYRKKPRSDLELYTHSTLSIIHRNKPYLSYSLTTNGKGDGNTIMEFSTYFLMSGLPYLFAPLQDKGLSVAVVGLGLGISTAVFSQLEEVSNIKAIEISPKVVEGIRQAPSYLNFEVFQKKKVNIVEEDAFKYFTRADKKFDIIVSQPSNIWVAGVENLFSREFYQLVDRSLSQGGILGQWLQNYSINENTLKMILRTVKSVFSYTELYKIGHKDVLILASQRPVNHAFPDKRFFDPFLYKFFKSFGIHNREDLYLSRIFDNSKYEKVLSPISNGDKPVIHSLTKPKLSYSADISVFLSQDSNPFDVLPSFINTDGETQRERIKVFQKYKSHNSDKWKNRCLKLNGFNFLCEYMNSVLEKYNDWQDKDINYPARLTSYSVLRKNGLIEHNELFLNKAFSKMMENKYLHNNTPLVYVNERISQGDYEIANAHIALLKEKKMITEDQFNKLKDHINNVKNNSQN